MNAFHRVMLAATVATVALAGSAHAAFTVTAPAAISLDTYLGTGNGAGYQNDTALTGPTSTISSITFTGSQSGVYSGSVSGVATSPFGAGSDADYLVAQPGGSVDITFSTPVKSFSLLWGSVDTFNFAASGGDMISGSAVQAADPSISFGTTNEPVTIDFSAPISSIVITSTQSAFEFVTATPVPEPASLVVLGAGLLGLGLFRRRSA